MPPLPAIAPRQVQVSPSRGGLAGPTAAAAPPGAQARGGARAPSSPSPSPPPPPPPPLHRAAPLYPPQPLTPAAQRALSFLTSVPVGTQAIAHSGGSALSDHLRGVYDVLSAWGAPEHVALAGLAHSVYATDGFQHPACLDLTPANRAAVAAAIGEQAEAVVYAFCITDRATSVGESQDDDLLATSPGGPPRAHRWRVRGDAGVAEAWVELSHAEWVDFTTLTLADWLEQVEEAAGRPNARFRYGPGEAWAYRRGAYRHMATLLGGQAAADYERVFGREPDATRGLAFDRPVAVG